MLVSYIQVVFLNLILQFSTLVIANRGKCNQYKYYTVCEYAWMSTYRLLLALCNYGYKTIFFLAVNDSDNDTELNIIVILPDPLNLNMFVFRLK